MPVRRPRESSPSPGGREGEAKGIFLFFSDILRLFFV